MYDRYGKEGLTSGGGGGGAQDFDFGGFDTGFHHFTFRDPEEVGTALAQKLVNKENWLPLSSILKKLRGI